MTGYCRDGGYIRQRDRQDSQSLKCSDTRDGEKLLPMVPFFQKAIFFDTYFSHFFAFCLLLVLIYKGYALNYPQGTLIQDIALIFFYPLLQHLRFYTAAIGSRSGKANHLTIFLVATSLTLSCVLYYQTFQVYILPFDYALSILALMLTVVEVVGAILTAILFVRDGKAVGTSSLALMFSALLCASTTGAVMYIGFMDFANLPHWGHNK